MCSRCQCVDTRYLYSGQGKEVTRQYVHQAKVGAQFQMTITLSQSVFRGEGSAAGLWQRSYNQINSSVVKSLLRNVVPRRAIMKRSPVSRMNDTIGVQRLASFNRWHSTAVSNQHGDVGRGWSATLSLKIVWNWKQQRRHVKIKNR